MSALATFLAWLAHLSRPELVAFLDHVYNVLHPGAHGVPRLVSCNPRTGCATYLDWAGRRIAVR